MRRYDEENLNLCLIFDCTSFSTGFVLSIARKTFDGCLSVCVCVCITSLSVFLFLRYCYHFDCAGEWMRAFIPYYYWFFCYRPLFFCFFFSSSSWMSVIFSSAIRYFFHSIIVRFYWLIKVFPNAILIRIGFKCRCLVSISIQFHFTVYSFGAALEQGYIDVLVEYGKL